jgi:hypothetical protein
VWRLCREEGIPIAVVGDNTLPAFFRGNLDLSEPMGPQRPLPLPDLLQECADTDLGILYEQRSIPGLAYRTRRSLYNQTPRVTLDLNQQAVEGPFEPVLDDQRLRNDITVSRPDGSSAQAVDQASIDAEGLYDDGVDANVWLDERLAEQAGWRLHLGTWPELRLPAVSTGLRYAGAGVIAQWLDADLGDLVALRNLMRQYDRDVDQLLEGYEETLSFFDWLVALTGSQAAPWQVGVLDDDTPTVALARLESDGSTLTADISTSATSLSVAVVGPLWTTSASYRPFDIMVGGERMTVTNLTGGASPQTFTVTRSVNGVEKAHLTGAAVELANPLRFAL